MKDKASPGQLAKIKSEIQDVIAYTDMSVREFVSGEIEKKDLLAARYTLHMKAIRLMEALDYMITLNRNTGNQD